MPAAPLVGAVTTRRPAAFSSLTASANRFTQSMPRRGSAMVKAAAGPVDWASSRSCRALARRRTPSPPGRTPSTAMPASMQALMAPRSRSRWAITSSRGRAEASLAMTTSETARPSRRQISSSSAEEEKGWGAGAARARAASGAARARMEGVPGSPASSMTKPPPTE